MQKFIRNSQKNRDKLICYKHKIINKFIMSKIYRTQFKDVTLYNGHMALYLPVT